MDDADYDDDDDDDDDDYYYYHYCLLIFGQRMCALCSVVNVSD